MAARYEKLSKVGAGAYAQVYKAIDKSNHDQVVALKRIRLDAEEEGVPCTAIREISLLKELRHDNIVRLLDVVYSEHKLTLVFEFLDQDLQNFMESRDHNLTPGQVQSFMRQLLAGIEHCHQRCVLHRDLKPQNLLISGEGRLLKVADFGLGRSFAIPVRKTTSAVVTLWYRSPDVLLGSTTYGTPIDLWSVGCIFAEMVHGVPLFDGRSDIDQLQKIFQFLGSPSHDTWPSLPSYPNSESMLSKPEFRVPFAPRCDAFYKTVQAKLGPQGVDLLRGLLQYEPERRLTASQALNHPYFSVKFAASGAQ
jgi:cyclin-dependent kinase